MDIPLFGRKPEPARSLRVMALHHTPMVVRKAENVLRYWMSLFGHLGKLVDFSSSHLDALFKEIALGGGGRRKANPSNKNHRRPNAHGILLQNQWHTICERGESP